MWPITSHALADAATPNPGLGGPLGALSAGASRYRGRVWVSTVAGVGWISGGSERGDRGLQRRWTPRRVSVASRSCSSKRRTRRDLVDFGRELDGAEGVHLLKGLRADTLILVGGHTNVCVHDTFVDAHQHDYYWRVVQDCVAGSSVDAHDAALRVMEHLQTGAARRRRKSSWRYRTRSRRGTVQWSGPAVLGAARWGISSEIRCRAAACACAAACSPVDGSNDRPKGRRARRRCARCWPARAASRPGTQPLQQRLHGDGDERLQLNQQDHRVLTARLRRAVGTDPVDQSAEQLLPDHQIGVRDAVGPHLHEGVVDVSCGKQGHVPRQQRPVRRHEVGFAQHGAAARQEGEGVGLELLLLFDGEAGEVGPALRDDLAGGQQQRFVLRHAVGAVSEQQMGELVRHGETLGVGDPILPACGRYGPVVRGGDHRRKSARVVPPGAVLLQPYPDPVDQLVRQGGELLVPGRRRAGVQQSRSSLAQGAQEQPERVR